MYWAGGGTEAGGPGNLDKQQGERWLGSERSPAAASRKRWSPVEPRAAFAGSDGLRLAT